MRNRCMFEKMAAGMALAAAVMAGAAMLPGSGHGLVINAMPQIRVIRIVRIFRGGY